MGEQIVVQSLHQVCAIFMDKKRDMMDVLMFSQGQSQVELMRKIIQSVFLK